MLESKNDLLDRRPVPGDLGQKCVNLHILWRHPQKSKTLQFFTNINYQLQDFPHLKSQLSSSIGRQVMTGQSQWQTVLKGLPVLATFIV